MGRRRCRQPGRWRDLAALGSLEGGILLQGDGAEERIVLGALTKVIAAGPHKQQGQDQDRTAAAGRGTGAVRQQPPAWGHVHLSLLDSLAAPATTWGQPAAAGG